MKLISSLTLLLLPVMLSAAGKAADCACGPECGKNGAACCCATEAAAPVETPAPKSHPLKGVITGMMPEKTALLVKHEEIPGVMRAMTMMFKVEPAVLAKVKQGDAIKGLMSRRDDGWWLHEVEVLSPQKG